MLCEEPDLDGWIQQELTEAYWEKQYCELEKIWRQPKLHLPDGTYITLLCGDNWDSRDVSISASDLGSYGEALR